MKSCPKRFTVQLQLLLFWLCLLWFFYCSFFFTNAAGTLTCFSVCFPEILLMMIFEIIENGVDLYTYYYVWCNHVVRLEWSHIQSWTYLDILITCGFCVCFICLLACLFVCLAWASWGFFGCFPAYVTLKGSLFCWVVCDPAASV